jgi:hypothetical protein
MRTLRLGLLLTCLLAGLLTACATPPDPSPGREPLQTQPPAGPLLYREGSAGKWGFQIGGGYSER